MKPISLHPDNPHYFLFRGKPTVLITSAEHYGAVVNPDFDYRTYLDVLAENDFNLTRLFVSGYWEAEKFLPWVGKQNTLYTKPGRLLCPWARSTEPGYANGGNKFDLLRWDEKFFHRLKDFCNEAGRRNIVVEITLFCVVYIQENWEISPFNAVNNINGIGRIDFTQFTSGTEPVLLERQKAMVRKFVAELAEFDNIFYEILNEPYWDQGLVLPNVTTPATDDWQKQILNTIKEAEKSLQSGHLIAQNIANDYLKVVDPNPDVAILNFHYAFPAAVTDNFHLNRLISFDETRDSFNTDDRRHEAWTFMLAGGGLYNNLDWSFATDDPTGTGKVKQAGNIYNGTELRRQLSILKKFLESFDFVSMSPAQNVVAEITPEITYYALARPGYAYAVYLLKGNQAEVTLNVVPGRYQAEWLNPQTGAIDKSEKVKPATGKLKLVSPPYNGDIALRLRRENP